MTLELAHGSTGNPNLNPDDDLVCVESLRYQTFFTRFNIFGNQEEARIIGGYRPRRK